ARRDASGRDQESVPPAGQVDANLTFSGGRGGGAFRHRELLLQRREKLLRSLPVQVLDDAVVGKDRDLARRKRHGEEEVVRLVSRVPPVLRLELAPRAGGARGPVMAVGDIEKRHRPELLGQSARGRSADSPDRVDNAARSRKIEEGLRLL